MAALAQQADLKLHYMTVRPALDEAITEDIFLPTPFIIMNSNQKLFTMTLWPDAIAQFFPTSDYVLRRKKRLFRTTEETVLVRHGTLMNSIGHLLTDYDFRGNRFNYLREEKKLQAASILEKLYLEPLEL
jgi:hypothetical protein